jgi:hypothetical protein
MSGPSATAEPGGCLVASRSCPHYPATAELPQALINLSVRTWAPSHTTSRGSIRVSTVSSGYIRCPCRYGDVDTWIAFPDSDEYIYPGKTPCCCPKCNPCFGTTGGAPRPPEIPTSLAGDNHETVSEYLATVEHMDNVAAVYMPWYLFGESQVHGITG